MSNQEPLRAPIRTPDASLPPLVPDGPRRKMLIEIEVSANFEQRLDNQWEVEREINADRWAWRWAIERPSRDMPVALWQKVEPHRIDFWDRIAKELDRAYDKHGSLPWGRHEFYAILLEEVEELWDSIKDDEPQGRVHKELIQVAAMCLRYFETGDRYRGMAR